MNAQCQGEAVWLAALSSRPTGVKRTMMIKVTLQVQPITPKELYSTRLRRKIIPLGKWLNINKVANNQLCKTGWEHYTTFEPLKLTEEARCWRRRHPSLKKWKKLLRSGSNVQLVLPEMFHRTVFRESHEEMLHLGVERVLHLTRQRSAFWPHMNKRHWTCFRSSLKKRRPQVDPRVPVVRRSVVLELSCFDNKASSHTVVGFNAYSV